MTGTPERPLHLTEAQLRHLEISLGQIITEIQEARTWFARWPLPGPSQTSLLRTLSALESRTRDMAKGLGLEPARLAPEPRAKLESLASHWWSVALDCRSEVLRGYGRLHPSTAPILDPLAEDPAASLLKVGRIGRPPPEPSGP